MLVAMIRDIGDEIGEGAIALFEHAILVVAEGGRAEPERSVRLEGVAFGGQVGEGGIDQASLVNRRLAGHDVETDTKPAQILVLFGALRAHPDLPAAAHAFLLRLVSEALSFLLQNRCSQLCQVLAMVATFGDGPRPSRLLLDPRPERPRHLVDLRAGVVDVELPRDRPSGPLEERSDAVAERGASAVADVQRAG